jgi:hypothetical protein
MVKGGSGAGFATKTLQCLGILRHIVGEKFKGDKSTERDVFGLVNHAHAAAAEFLEDAVVRDGASDHTRPIVVWSITGGKSYVGEKGKSMKGVELRRFRNERLRTNAARVFWWIWALMR